MYRKYFKHEKGITGLETAIILIAFVVVAAVFAYTTLSAGLFSTQKSQEAVYSGLREARATLELKGNVIATANESGSSGRVQQISFIVANVLGGEAIDFTEPTPTTGSGVSANTSSNKVVINYVDEYQTVNDLYWTLEKLGGTDSDDLLESNEKFKVTIGSDTAGSDGGNLINALSVRNLNINTEFSLIVQTPIGAVLEIERTIPAFMDIIMNLR